MIFRASPWWINTLQFDDFQALFFLWEVHFSANSVFDGIHWPFSWELVSIKNSKFAILGPQEMLRSIASNLDIRLWWPLNGCSTNLCTCTKRWHFFLILPLDLFNWWFFTDATIGFIAIENQPFDRISRCLFQICFHFQPYLGKIPILTHMFEMGMGFSTTNPDIYILRNYIWLDIMTHITP